MIQGCGKVQEDVTTATSGGTPNNPPVGQVQNDKMWVRVFDQGLYSHYLHTVTPANKKPPFNRFTNNFGTPCEISPTTTPGTATDIFCLLHMQEGDMYVHGLQLQANVPAGMCTYFRRMPPFFYNFEPGYVSATVTINTTNGVPSGCSVTGTPLGTGAGSYSVDFTAPSTICTVRQNSVDIFNVDFTTSAVTMSKYDFRPEGPNCAIGQINVVKVALDTTTSPNITTTTRSEIKFAQKRSELSGCLRGPAVDGGNWSSKDTSDWPVGLVSPVLSTGLNERMDVNGFQKTNNGTRHSAHIANMFDYKYALFASSPARVQTNDPLYLPNLFHPNRDRGNNDLNLLLPAYDRAAARDGYATSQYTYEFECLDAAWETKARIRLFVADWNTKEDFDSYATNQASSDPDRIGLETGGSTPNCKYIPGIGYDCNDWEDTDDFLRVLFSYPNEVKR
jgi:hypothetical protein